MDNNAENNRDEWACACGYKQTLAEGELRMDNNAENNRDEWACACGYKQTLAEGELRMNNNAENNRDEWACARGYTQSPQSGLQDSILVNSLGGMLDLGTGKACVRLLARKLAQVVAGKRRHLSSASAESSVASTWATEIPEKIKYV